MILVAGATGVLGSEIVRNLLGRGEKVRAMTRATSKPETVGALREAGAEIVVADVKDPASLANACKDVKSVISTVTSVTTAQPGDSFEVTDGQGTKSLIDAARKAGAEKFVFVHSTRLRPDAPLPRAAQRRVTPQDWARRHHSPPVSLLLSWLGPDVCDPVPDCADLRNGTKRLVLAVADVADLAVHRCLVHSIYAVIPFGDRTITTRRTQISEYRS